MLTYISRRVLYSIPVILIATFFAFWAVRTTFDPTAKVRTSKTGARAAEQIRQKLHLHDPIVEQYGRWLGDAAQGNLGESERTNEAVSTMITRSFGKTLQNVTVEDEHAIHSIMARECMVQGSMVVEPQIAAEPDECSCHGRNVNL